MSPLNKKPARKAGFLFRKVDYFTNTAGEDGMALGDFASAWNTANICIVSVLYPLSAIGIV